MKKINSSYMSQLKYKIRFTTSAELAIEAAKLSGEKPINHVSPRLRDAYLVAYPELGRKVKKSA